MKLCLVKKSEDLKIDDTFAKNFGAKDLKDLENMIGNQISKEYESVTDQLLKKEILDDLDKKFTFDLPKGLLEDEVQNVEYLTGMEIKSLLSDLNNLYEDNTLDLDGTVLIRFSDKFKGVLRASQVATGEENNIKVAIYGKKGAYRWEQEKNIRDFYQKNPAELTTPVS